MEIVECEEEMKTTDKEGFDYHTVRELLQMYGIVGAGGAGFPTYMKIDKKASIILMNCAECEPLLRLHRQLLEQCAYEIMKAFQMIAETLEVKEAIIGIKKHYVSTIEAVEQWADEFPLIRIKLLDNVYPVGDEVALIYEATGKVVRPGGLPIEEGVAVFNVETVYNIYRAWIEGTPVVDKLVTIVGEVENPITVRVPLGVTVEETIRYAGKMTTEQPAFLMGGGMMGRIVNGKQPITKTSNAILVLPSNHYLIQVRKRTISSDLQRTASACCQCQMCTDLCPRHALGYPIEPHKFMRYASHQDVQDTSVFLNTMFCSSCGLCELYSCPQGLSPRTLITEYKTKLRQAGVKAPEVRKKPVVSLTREYRKVPEERLEARIGLSQYHKNAPLHNEVLPAKRVKIMLNQHIGAPAKPIVTVGQVVKVGDIIAKPEKGLSVAIHASVPGRILEVKERYILIKKEQ